jgi:hypothetical protein
MKHLPGSMSSVDTDLRSGFLKKLQIRIVSRLIDTDLYRLSTSFWMTTLLDRQENSATHEVPGGFQRHFLH